mmetsp:Transcript_16688/g.25104  ORF Transcript_16688/g.25104 Transcript_16688/m.25104 type:complete len:411 (-) Transcript_16688:8-1240(-)
MEVSDEEEKYYFTEARIVYVGRALGVDLRDAKLPSKVNVPHMTIFFRKAGYNEADGIGKALCEEREKYLKTRNLKRLSFHISPWGKSSSLIKGQLYDFCMHLRSLPRFEGASESNRKPHVQLCPGRRQHNDRRNPGGKMYSRKGNKTEIEGSSAIVKDAKIIAKILKLKLQVEGLIVSKQVLAEVKAIMKEEERKKTINNYLNKAPSSNIEENLSGGKLSKLLNPNMDRKGRKPVKFVCISDTHSKHSQYFGKDGGKLPAGDVLIHAGDFTRYGTPKQILSFVEWFDGLKQFRHKILISGNHEFTLDRKLYDRLSDSVLKKGLRHSHRFTEEETINLIKDRSSIHYLVDETVCIEGIRIFGSPASTAHSGSAFERTHSENEQAWRSVPIDTEILITHGPPLGAQDTTKKR